MPPEERTQHEYYVYETALLICQALVRKSMGLRFIRLRRKMDEIGGTIFSFDNVPGNIFKGKKYGIFNSNTANSTRAAITILDPHKKGYLVSPFIRFKTEDRTAILNAA